MDLTESSPQNTYFTNNEENKDSHSDTDDENSSDTFNDSSIYNEEGENEETTSYNNDEDENSIYNNRPLISNKLSKNYHLPSNIHILRVENITESRNFSCQAQNSFGLVIYNLTIMIKGNF